MCGGVWNTRPGHAIVWRDAIVQYFLKLSGIADEHGRAGNTQTVLKPKTRGSPVTK
jgi:hypothetical protein